jgi:hypothetical protein
VLSCQDKKRCETSREKENRKVGEDLGAAAVEVKNPPLVTKLDGVSREFELKNRKVEQGQKEGLTEAKPAAKRSFPARMPQSTAPTLPFHQSRQAANVLLGTKRRNRRSQGREEEQNSQDLLL